MLSLDSPRWSQLRHAYGDASDIPALLRQLEASPSANDHEPWFSIWSALAHQGDVYSASFAAVPHVVRILAGDPERGDATTFFQFPGWVEICRAKTGERVPDDLLDAYDAALARLPALVASAASREWDDDFLRAALSAIAAAKGSPAVAEAVMELTPEVAEEFIEWNSER
jgi:hypothetical protein